MALCNSTQSMIASVGKAPRVVVVGDLMLDQTTIGPADRTSPEAPVVVLRAGQITAAPGGAAAVARLLQGFEVPLRVAVFGVVGADAAGQRLGTVLAEVGVETAGIVVDSSRPTTVKDRFIGQAAGRHAQQLLRVDHESTAPLDPKIEEQLGEAIESTLDDAAVVLISDYGKGVCTPALLARVISAARSRSLPVIIDPARTAAPTNYAGATLIKPNRSWVEQVLGQPLPSVAAAVAASANLQALPGWQETGLLLTLDRDGMVLQLPGTPPMALSGRPRSVYDVTGAGDMVHATPGVSGGAGRSLVRGCGLGGDGSGTGSGTAGCGSRRLGRNRTGASGRRRTAIQNPLSGRTLGGLPGRTSP